MPADEARSLQRQHHLVNRRRVDAKIFLYVGFGRGPAMQPGVEVDKRQILPLLGREGFSRRTYAGHPIQLFVRASNEEARHECTLSGRTQPSRAHRTQGAAQAASMRPASSSDHRFCWPPTSVGVGGSTVYRTKRRFVEGNLEQALSEEPRPGAERKLTGKQEAFAGGDRLCRSSKGPCPLDAQAAGRCDGQAHRTQEPVARDGSATPSGK